MLYLFPSNPTKKGYYPMLNKIRSFGGRARLERGFLGYERINVIAFDWYYDPGPVIGLYNLTEFYDYTLSPDAVEIKNNLIWQKGYFPQLFIRNQNWGSIIYYIPYEHALRFTNITHEGSYRWNPLLTFEENYNDYTNV